jgi:hypothetical protein
VRAIKKIPPMLLMLDLESTELEKLLGSVISKSPKKERANMMKTAVKKRLSQMLVEIVFRILACPWGRK